MSTVVTPEREPTARPRKPWYRRRWVIITAVVVVLLGAGLGGAIWWFLRDDAPARVSLDAATQSITSTKGHTTVR